VRGVVVVRVLRGFAAVLLFLLASVLFVVAFVLCITLAALVARSLNLEPSLQVSMRASAT